MLLLVALEAAYVAGVLRARTWRPRRTIAFTAGLAVLAVALVWLDAPSSRQLSAHMLQHGLVAMVAAPLTVAGAPLRLLLLGLGRDARRVAARGLHALAPLSHPAVALVLWTATTALFHVPAVYDLALEQPALHGLEHAAFFWTAVALWASLTGGVGARVTIGTVGRASVVLAAMAVMSVGGAALASAERVVFTFYTGSAALSDQHTAGGVMWVGGMVAALPLLLVLCWRSLSEEERRQRVRERHAVTR